MSQILPTAPAQVHKLWLVALVGMTAVYAYFYFTRHEHFLDWQIESSTDRTEFAFTEFGLGPFRVEVPAFRYTISEEFSGSAVNDTSHLTTPLLITIWVGICYLLAAFTYFRRTTFIVLYALFLFFLISLQLDSYPIFGMAPPSRVGTGIVAFLYLGLGYSFHAFLLRVPFWARGAAFAALTVILGWYLNSAIPHFPNYLIASGTYGMAIMAILFVILVAEEIIFGILFVTTQSKGKNSEKHFIIACVVYLLFVTLYYLKKAGIYPNILPIVNPYWLLVISVLVSIWSLRFKQEFFNTNTGTNLDLRHLLVGMGLIGLAFLAIGFASGNDPLYESFHYLIIYIHLGFGGAFLLYIILNFIDALIDGHSVYRIAYKERNFPYVTCRLVGLIAVAAFFFQANKEPMELTQAARYNALGEHAIKTNEGELAEQYFIAGAVSGHNNHLSNYQLAMAARFRGNETEQALRYRNATNRYPTPQAFVNAALAAQNTSQSQVFLERGIIDFPSAGELQNNLAVHYTTTSRWQEALDLLNESGGTGDWNKAPETNRWKVFTHLGQDVDIDPTEFLSSNNAVRTNMISNLLSREANSFPPIDTTLFQGALNLHGLTLLNNAAYTGAALPFAVFRRAVQYTYNVQLQNDLKIAGALNLYRHGDVNTAVQTMEGLLVGANPFQEAEIANVLGLLMLEQGVYDRASEYLRTASENAHTEASFHLAISLMEQGKFDDANRVWQDLLVQQPSYLEAYSQVQSIFTSNPAPILTYYYQWKSYPPSKLAELLTEIQASPEFVNSIWRKISLDARRGWDAALLESYLQVFEGQLDASTLERANFDLAVLSGDSPGSIPQYANAFDETMTIAQARILLNAGEEIAGFNMLAAASASYPTSVNYLKHYTLLAVQIGLRDYAEDGLAQLRQLMESGEFRSFQREYQRTLNSLPQDFQP